MMLRNRKTGKLYDRDGKPLASASTMYSTPTYAQALPKILATVPESLRETAAKLLDTQRQDSEKDAVKIERAKKLAAIFSAAEQQILEISKHPEELQNIMQACQTDVDTKSTAPKKADDEPDFVSHLATTLAVGAANNVFPFAGTLLLALAPAAAAASGLSATNSGNVTENIVKGAADAIQIHSGQPAGGQDLCPGINPYCIQGYLTDSDQQVLAQFSRNMVTSTSGDNNGPSLAMLDCLDINKIGSAVRELFGNSTTQGGNVCAANSIQVNGATAVVQGVKLPVDCNSFQQAMNIPFNECIQYNQNVGMWIGIGIACFAGAAALAVGMTFGVCYLRDRCRH